MWFIFSLSLTVLKENVKQDDAYLVICADIGIQQYGHNGPHGIFDLLSLSICAHSQILQQKTSRLRLTLKPRSLHCALCPRLCYFHLLFPLVFSPHPLFLLPSHLFHTAKFVHCSLVMFHAILSQLQVSGVLKKTKQVSVYTRTHKERHAQTQKTHKPCWAPSGTEASSSASGRDPSSWSVETKTTLSYTINVQ